MTRDEAIKLLGVHLPPMSEGYFGKLVDAFGALGMLKLDKPKSAYEKLADAMGTGHWGRDNIMRAIDNAGLKIVEK